MNLVLGAIAGLTLGVVIVLILVVLDVQARLQRLEHIDAKLDVLLKQQGLAHHATELPPPENHEGFSPVSDVTQEIHDALVRGDKLEAVRLYRNSAGVSLMEAKNFIEEVQRRQATTK